MTNSIKTPLVKMGKIGFKRLSDLSNPRNNFHSLNWSNGSIYHLSYILEGPRPYLISCFREPKPLIQKRFNHDESAGQDETQHTNSRSYQRQHRRSYERKRSEYEGNRKSGQGSDGSDNNSSRREMTHYERLNVQADADIDTIKSAYYSLSKVYHPDIAGDQDPIAVEKFRLLSDSYQVLSNPNSRSEYDSQLNEIVKSDVLHQTVATDSTEYHKPLYRAKDADSIFRLRKDAALQREKILNPRRFRAGVFTSSSRPTYTAEDISKLRKQLDDMERNQKSSRCRDGSDFYRLHLFDTIQRRHDDMLLAIQGSVHNSSREDDNIVLLVMLGAFAASGLFFFSMYVGFDLAARLDEHFAGENNDRRPTR